ncbi:MAG TPA: glycosyltransferase family 39 protein [Acidobacteriaceae bacterium]|nr:glycosyltransferase family 39 protein [Acidobacteriaceae bacterium]
MDSNSASNLEESPDKKSNQVASSASSRWHLNWRASVLLLTVLWGAIYMIGLSRPPLLDDVDTVHAEAAREMLQRHEWVTMYTNGFRYLEKAPLMYWSLIASYKVFGISNWSTRLPLMLAVLGLLLATWLLGRFAYGEAGGFCSGLVMATSLGLFIYTRFLIPEVIVSLWLTLGYYFFLRSLEQERPSLWLCWGFAATCALNVLTKGLIGLVFPIGTIGLFLLLTGDLRRLLKMRLLSSSLVFLAIAAPWHILAALRNPPAGQARGFLWLYFINEQFMRFLGKRVPAGYGTVPLFLFWALFVLWLFPWFIFLPQALGEVPVRWSEIRGRLGSLDRRRRANLLFLLWALVIAVFFSFSTRQEYYTIPGLPGVALLVGGWLALEAASPKHSSARRAGRISSTFLLALGVLGFIAGIYFFAISHRPAPGYDLADLLRKAPPKDYNFSLGHMLDLTPEALGAFQGPLLVASLALLLGTGFNWFLRRRGHSIAANAAVVVMTVALFGCIRSAYVTFSPILSSYPLAVAIQKHFRPGDEIVIDGQYSDASTLNYYTGIQVHVLGPPRGNLWYGAKFPDAPHIFETPQSLAAIWNGRETIFVWAKQENPPQLADLKTFLLASSGGKFIYTNHDLRQ